MVKSREPSSASSTSRISSTESLRGVKSSQQAILGIHAPDFLANQAAHLIGAGRQNQPVNILEGPAALPALSEVVQQLWVGRIFAGRPEIIRRPNQSSPKCHCQMRFTITRLVSKWDGFVSHSPSSFLPLPRVTGVCLVPARTTGNCLGTTSPGITMGASNEDLLIHYLAFHTAQAHGRYGREAFFSFSCSLRRRDTRSLESSVRIESRSSLVKAKGAVCFSARLFLLVRDFEEKSVFGTNSTFGDKLGLVGKGLTLPYRRIHFLRPFPQFVIKRLCLASKVFWYSPPPRGHWSHRPRSHFSR